MPQCLRELSHAASNEKAGGEGRRARYGFRAIIAFAVLPRLDVAGVDAIAL